MSLLPHETPKKSNPGQLDLSQLVTRANNALDSGDATEAVECLRLAVRKAPMRADLRDMLFAALERKGGPANGEPGPKPMRRMSRPPLFEEPANESPMEEPQIEEIRVAERRPEALRRGPPRNETLDEPRMESAPPRPRSRETAREESIPPIQRPRARHHERSRQSPISALALVMFMLVFVGAVGGGGAWLYLARYKSTGEQAKLEGEAKKSEENLTARQDKALTEQAKEYLDQKLYALAIEKLNLLSDTEEKHRMLAATFAEQADTYSHDKKYDEARRAYEKALESEPKNDQYAYDLGWTYYMLGREKQGENKQAAKENFERAEQHFKAALAVNANHTKALDGLARVEIARGNSPGAGEYYRKIIQIDPKSPEAESAKRKLKDMGLRTGEAETALNIQ